MNLDQLSDAEISELVAVEVAGWTNDDGKWKDRDGFIVLVESTYFIRAPSFATDPSAIIPLLEKLKGGGFWLEIKDHTNGLECGIRDWLVIVTSYNPSDDDIPYRSIYIEGVATTFARAAAIALLKAKRATASAPAAPAGS